MWNRACTKLMGVTLGVILVACSNGQNAVDAGGDAGSPGDATSSNDGSDAPSDHGTDVTAADVSSDGSVLDADTGTDATATDVMVVDARTDSGGATDSGVRDGGGFHCGVVLASCDPATVCCAHAPSFTCVAPGTCTTGGVLACAGAIDCPSGDVCCFSGYTTQSSSCQLSCTGMQFCTTTAECTPPMTCVVSAYYGYSTCR